MKEVIVIIAVVAGFWAGMNYHSTLYPDAAGARGATGSAAPHEVMP